MRGHTGRRVGHPSLVSTQFPDSHDLTFRASGDESVIGAVGDMDEAPCIDRDPTGYIELVASRSLTESPYRDEGAMGSPLLNAVVVGVSDVDVSG